MTQTTSKLGLRLVTGLVLGIFVLALVLVPAMRLPLTIFIAMLSALGLFEYYNLARAKGVIPAELTGIISAMVLVLSAYWDSHTLVSALFFLAAGTVVYTHILRGLHSVSGVAISVFGVLYVGWMPAHFILLHGLRPEGVGLVAFLIVSVVLCDTGAYFVGKSLGRHKMAPRLSPNKTWEGAVGGLSATALSSLVLYVLRRNMDWTSLPNASLHWYILTGLCLGIASQVGDLAESMLKRDAGVKDSGAIVPGHGGVLDRCDGFLLATPVLYYLTVLFGIPSAP